MELSYDWRSFQKAFFPQRRGSLQQKPVEEAPFFIVVDHGIVVCAFSEAEDVSDWVGSSKQEVLSRFEHRELIVFERDEVDHWLAEAQQHSHYYDQIEALKTQALPVFSSTRVQKSSTRAARKIHKEAVRKLTRQHFLLEALQGGWKKFLPASFGIYIEIRRSIQESETSEGLLLVVRNGHFEGFHHPDVTALDASRAQDPAVLLKYLSEKHILPVQGIFVQSQDWERWSALSDPWRCIRLALRKKQALLYPHSLGLRFLIFIRARLGF